MQAIKDLFGSEKGFVAFSLLVAATVLTGIGKMTVDQWTGFCEWISVAFFGSHALQTVGLALAKRPVAPSVATSPSAVGGTTNVIVPPADPSPSPAITPQGGFARLPLLIAMAAIGALLALSSSCGAARGAANAAGKAVVDCTTANARSLITQFGPVLESALVSATHGDGSLDTDAVKSITRNFAADTGMCVAASVFAAAIAPKSTDPNAPQSSPVAADPTALRATFGELAKGKRYQTDRGEI